MVARPRVGVFSLGGTIAMADVAGAGGVTPELDAGDLLAQVPGLTDGVDVTSASFRRMPGVELTLADIVALADELDRALAADLDGAVVTQGTDTLEETAFLLDLLMAAERPVVMTAAMRPADAVGADGPANLTAAVQVAASGATRGLGVVVVLGDEVHAASLCRKAHTSRPAAFVSDPGAIGWVTEGVPYVALAPLTRLRLSARPRGEARIALVPVALGDDGELLRRVDADSFDGVVVEALGGGHVPRAVADEVGRLADVMPVAIASRTRVGTVLNRTYGFPGGEIDLLDRGAITAGWLDATKSRILMMALLAGGATRAEVAAAFEFFGGAHRGAHAAEA